MSRFLDPGFILRDLRDGGKVEHGSGCWVNLTCAESKEDEVVDELLVLGHAKFLLRESGLHVKVPNPQALVSDAFRHELIKKVTISIRIA